MARQVAEKGWGAVIGQPDAWDKKNIRALIDTFNNTVFTLPVSDEPDAPKIKITGKQWITEMVRDARKQHQLEGNDGSDYGEKSKMSAMRILCAIPQPLHKKLQEGYPTLFKDREHHIWFAKNFREFLVPRKI